MKVKVKEFKDDSRYCWGCGKEINKAYILNMGSAGAEFDMCRACLRRLKVHIDKALSAK